jgi:hypothetical protein
MHAPVFENRMRRFSFLYRHSPGSIFTEFPCPWFLVPVTSAYLFVGMRTTLTPAVSPARTAGDFSLRCFRHFLDYAFLRASLLPAFTP